MIYLFQTLSSITFGMNEDFDVLGLDEYEESDDEDNDGDADSGGDDENEETKEEKPKQEQLDLSLFRTINRKNGKSYDDIFYGLFLRVFDEYIQKVDAHFEHYLD